VKIGSKHFRTIWLKPDDQSVVQLIDQRFLPHQFVIEEIRAVVKQTRTLFCRRAPETPATRFRAIGEAKAAGVTAPGYSYGTTVNVRSFPSPPE
jgi:methylthioribose-1-phosphate isomerase